MSPTNRQALVARLEIEAGIYANCRGPLNVNGCVEVMPVLLDQLVKLLRDVLALLRADEGEPPAVTPDERERLHNLLQDFWSVTSPEQFPDLCEQAYQELKDCHSGCRPPEGSDAHDPENAKHHEPGTPDTIPAPSRPAGGAAKPTFTNAIAGEGQQRGVRGKD